MSSSYNANHRRHKLQAAICPITMGMPTSMADAGAAKACAHQTRDRESKKGFGSGSPETTIYDEHCKQCGGEYPPELTIIKLEEIDMGSVTSYQGTCEMCLKPERTLRKVLDKKCCSTCEHIRRAAHKSPMLLVDALDDAQGKNYFSRIEVAPLSKKPDDNLFQLQASKDAIETLKLQLQASKDAVETLTGINETMTADYASMEQMVKDLRECNGNLQMERMEMLDNIDALKTENARSMDLLDQLRVSESNALSDLGSSLKDNLSLIQEIEQLRQAGWLEPVSVCQAPSDLPLSLAGFGGYDALYEVLHAALTQAAIGKGKERHANDEPFEEQDICTITRSEGHGFTRGQAIKKIKEAKRLDRDAAIRELLGAINYLAADVIVLGEVA